MENNSKTVRVFSGTDLLVGLLKEELAQQGISSVVQNDYNSGISSGFFGGVPSAVDLYIQENDLKKAEPIIQDFVQRNQE